ncbi:MAG TPA: L-seryl-tRNA(Sec) selenium transferase [Anaerolineaceae bacterium]
MSERDRIVSFRNLPSVEQLLQTPKAAALIAAFGRLLTVEAIREALADARVRLRDGASQPAIESEALLEDSAARLDRWTQPSLVPVINATGVVLHTNMGRAPLSRQAIQAMQFVASGYSNLEFDLERGARGSRLVHAEALLRRLTGAEAALVVNNNAAALLLALTALSKRRRAIISRTQLVEIGGGFRIPEVMSQSGAKLVEVGTTNRVHLHDYEEALQEPAGVVMRAHHSNFRIIGFTTEPSIEEIVGVAQTYGVPVIDDLGSGVLLDTARFGLAHEPTVQESLAAGADLVCFSGDKLLGGPQAGILLGKAHLIAKLKKHPLARAVRADKLCLAALSATLVHYLKDEAEREIPIWRMILLTPAQIQERAARWAQVIGAGEVIRGQSTVGGGSLPEETLPTWLLALTVAQPNRFLARLRAGSPPVIARIETDQVVLDPRTVLPEEEDALLVNLKKVLSNQAKS